MFKFHNSHVSAATSNPSGVLETTGYEEDDRLVGQSRPNASSEDLWQGNTKPE